MPGRDIVVVGFSAGGIDPLVQLVAGLPADVPASFFVVHHFPAHSISALPHILNRAGGPSAFEAVDGAEMVHGRIYVAPPDQHLLLLKGRMRLTRGPQEQGHRPAIDPLFRTAARTFGTRVIGVILSGMLDDGTAGLVEIKTHGGLALVQDPKEAAYPAMPVSAISHVEVDHVAAARDLAVLLDRLVREPAPDPPPVRRAHEFDPADPEPAVAGSASLRIGDPPGRPSSLTCPDCGGVLWGSESGSFLHFRCHVGHAFSEESLLASQAHGLEEALWSAVRALEEKAELSRQLAERSGQRGLRRAAAQFHAAAHDAEQGSGLIREALLRGPVRRAIESPADPEVLDVEARLSGTDSR